MNWRIVRSIAQKDIKEVLQNTAAIIPATIVPLVFMVVMPLLLVVIPQVSPMSMDELLSDNSPIKMMLTNVPGLQQQVAGLNGTQMFITLMAGYFMAPYFLILPLMLASIIGADSFVGEKERKTLEGLLYTPASDGELFLGKFLASVIPAILLAWIGFVIYAVVVNVAGLPVMGRVWFPLPNWWPLMLFVTPAVAAMGTAVTVLVSSRVSTFMAANQMSGALVLIILALVAGQATGILFLNVLVSILVGAVLWAIDAVLLHFGVRGFSRSKLISRL